MKKYWVPLEFAAKGIFINEIDNRFKCIVDIDDHQEICYVPSSCRLQNLINANGKEIFLVKVKNLQSKLRYSLLAMRFGQSLIFLNSSLANLLVKAYLEQIMSSSDVSKISIKSEYNHNGYKADFYVPSEDLFIEVKSIISALSMPQFLSVNSERAVRQLSAIQKILSSGSVVHYYIICLNPYTRSVLISQNKEIAKLLEKNIASGLVVKAFSCNKSGNRLSIGKQLPIVFR